MNDKNTAAINDTDMLGFLSGKNGLFRVTDIKTKEDAQMARKIMVENRDKGCAVPIIIGFKFKSGISEYIIMFNSNNDGVPTQNCYMTGISELGILEPTNMSYAIQYFDRVIGSDMLEKATFIV